MHELLSRSSLFAGGSLADLEQIREVVRIPYMNMPEEYHKMSMSEVRAALVAQADARYREFCAGLLPAGARLLGVRLPTLRSMAKRMARGGQWRLASAPDAWMEELMLRGMLVGYAPRDVSVDERLAELEGFVPLIDNWSVCDSCCITYRFARTHRERVWEWLAPYLRSELEFCARFGVVMLWAHYRQERAWAARVAAALPGVPAEAYYAAMGVAWCACELALLYPAIGEQLLPALTPRVQKLARRKMRESRRC